MTPRQKIEIRQSEIRLRLNQINMLEGTDYSEEIQNEEKTLLADWIGGEARMKTAIIAEDPLPADPQLVNLESRASLGAIVTCAINNRPTSGAERELQDEMKVENNQIPLCLLQEARAVTPAPTSGTGVGQREIVPAVFPDSAHEFLAISATTVPAGSASFPHLTTSAVPSLPDEGGTVAASVGAFTALALMPKRIQASFEWSREASHSFAGMSEALRANLQMSLGDALDKAVISELLKAGVLSANNASSADTFATLRTRLLYDAVDGIFASHPDELRVLLGPASFRYAGSLYKGTASELSAAESLAATNSIRISPHVTAIASKKQNAIVRRGSRVDSALGVWEGVSLISDEISGSATGTIRLTAVMLFNFAVTRADGFRKLQIQVV